MFKKQNKKTPLHKTIKSIAFSKSGLSKVYSSTL